MPKVLAKDQFIRVQDASDLVTYIHIFQDVLDNHAQSMPAGAYKELTDSLYGLYCLEFYHTLEVISGGVSRPRSTPRMTNSQIRKLAANDPTKAINCEICNTPLMIRSYEKHLKTKKCKDFHLTIRASGGSVADRSVINDLVIQDYENGYCPPVPETGSEHQFHSGGASGLED